MKSLGDHLSNYATYHRDRRNITTHFIGIPLIVLGIQALLARAAIDVGGTAVSVAMVASAGAALFYLALDLRFGLAMSAILGATLWTGTMLAGQPFGTWLATAGGLFIGGWVIQFVGHVFEGKKPAFVDDLVGLLVGPLFVTAELGFALGLRRELHTQIEHHAGPTRTGATRATQA